MRACARVALASIAVSASISLSGCAAIEELKETFLRWVESQKLPSGRGVSAGETPKKPSKRHAQPKDAAHKPQRQTIVLPPTKPPIPARPRWLCFLQRNRQCPIRPRRLCFLQRNR